MENCIATSLEQSKKLLELGLSHDTADMFWIVVGDSPRLHVLTEPLSNYSHWDNCPAWSLAALYNILPNTEHISTTLSRGGWIIEQPEYIDKWWCEYEDDNDHARDVTVTADNAVDACVDMIKKLHELKML